ncbi:MAG TPA: glycosyltransferase [Bryobacteraceae bacterium]|nr:glycosyltransferase [Bryobacteraceae bacterium]
MNVLFISHCDFPNNSALHIFSIARNLAEEGLDCIVCVPGGEPALASVARFSVVSYGLGYSGRILFPDGRGPDLIHAWTPRERVRKLTFHLLASKPCKYVLHLEDNEEFILDTEMGALASHHLRRLPEELMDATAVPDHLSHPLRSRKFLAGASGLTAIVDRLLEFKPASTPGIVLWPGFDPEFLSASAASRDQCRQMGISDDESVLVYSGNIHSSNAAEVRSLFWAVQALRRAGRRVVLLKTGSQYVSADWITDATRAGAVLDLGFIPREALYSIMQRANILVQPGRIGPFNDYRFPSKLPEFFASGKPVILPRTNVGLAVRDGVEALLLQSGDAIEIAQKIEILLDNPGLAARLGAAGREFAIRRLSWSKNVPALKEFYASLQ